MGWSCSAAAGDTMRAMDQACRAQTGSSNSWAVDPNGVYDRDHFTGKREMQYFWECSRVEHRDGRITGTVIKLLSSGHGKRVGSICIDAEGNLKRCPKSLQSMISAYYGITFVNARQVYNMPMFKRGADQA